MSLIKSASIVSLLTLASRITGLVRELLIASTFGASAMTDAFNVAFRIPNFFRRLFGEGAFSQAFVPVLAATRAQQGPENTHLLIDRVATVLLWTLLATCLVGVLGSPLLVWAMASGLQQNPRGFDVAVVMTRWMFPYIGFMSLVALAAGVLNTWKRFAVPAVTPVLLNVCMIGAAWLGGPWFQTMGLEPIYALCGGVLLGGVLQLTVQWVALHQMGLMPRIAWRWDAIRAAWTDPGTKNVASLMVPALLGVSVAQISTLINTQIASHLPSGSVSWLTYADRLMEFPTALLGVALGVVLIPALSSAHAKKDTETYSRLLDWGLRLVLVLTVPCAVALGVFAVPLAASLYHYGAFTSVDVQQTALALASYGVGLLGLVAIKVLAPGYYASQNIKTPVKIAVAVLVITQLLNLVFVPMFAHAGLALSIGAGALINALWLLLGLMRSKTYLPQAGWGKLLIQVGIASVLLGAALFGLAYYLPWLEWRAMPHGAWQRILSLFGIISVGGLAYFAMLALMGLNFKALLKAKNKD
ncbi:MAG: murein biosynthesis integral membrane protein MurJ [Rhodoferax sp.]